MSIYVSNRIIPRVGLGTSEPGPGPGGGGLVVENVAALTALDDSELEDETPCRVRSLRCPWVLRKGSTAAVDGITVAATASGTGRWHRAETDTDWWARRTTWYIDQENGNDENDGGTAELPLRTNDELVRRIGNYIGTSGFVSIYVIGDYSGNIDWRSARRVRLVNYPVLMYHGERTVLRTGTLTGVTPYNPGGGVVGRITDSTLPSSWSELGLIDKFITFTTGPCAGRVGVLVRDLGGNSANYHQPIDLETWEQGDPQVGDEYVVYDVSLLAGFVYVTGPMTILLFDFRVQPPGPNWVDALRASSDGFIGILSCAVANGLTFADSEAVIDGIGSIWLAGCYNVRASSSGVIALDGSVVRCTLFTTRGGQIVLYEHCMTIADPTVGLSVAAHGAVEVTSSGWWVVVGMPAGSVVARTRCGNNSVFYGLLWGTDNNCDYVLVAGSDSSIRYVTVPTCGPSVIADVRAGSVAASYADLPVVDGTSLAGIVRYYW